MPKTGNPGNQPEVIRDQVTASDVTPDRSNTDPGRAIAAIGYIQEDKQSSETKKIENLDRRTLDKVTELNSLLNKIVLHLEEMTGDRF